MLFYELFFFIWNKKQHIFSMKTISWNFQIWYPKQTKWEKNVKKLRKKRKNLSAEEIYRVEWCGTLETLYHVQFLHDPQEALQTLTLLRPVLLLQTTKKNAKKLLWKWNKVPKVASYFKLESLFKKLEITSEVLKVFCSCPCSIHFNFVEIRLVEIDGQL